MLSVKLAGSIATYHHPYYKFHILYYRQGYMELLGPIGQRVTRKRCSFEEVAEWAKKYGYIREDL